ncbi:hypothetical protein HAX54_036769, partial [Datura stramonium]|nr:hypothetical protein [Datura stramonium]
MHENSVPNSSTAAVPPVSNNSPPPPPPPLPRRVVFRLLCHASRVGGVSENQFQSSDNFNKTPPPRFTLMSHAKLRPPPHRCCSLPSVNRKIRLFGPIEISSGMKNSMKLRFRLHRRRSRVLRVIEVTAENDGVVLGVENVVSCRLLVKGNQIEGDILAVKKALVAIPEQTFPVQPVELPAQRSSTSQPISTSSFSAASGCHPVSLDADKFSSIDSKKPEEEVVFRILCTKDKVGAIIGKGGAIVRALQNDSGASIAVGPNVAECNERMITISAFEDLEVRRSPAQTAAVLVFGRILDAGSGMNLGTRSLITFRLVVENNQVGCLLGKGGSIISDIRKETGTSIRIFRGDQVPKCVCSHDEVVQ